MTDIEQIRLPGIEIGITGLQNHVEPVDAYTALRQTGRVTTATRWLVGDLAWAAIDQDPKRIPELLQTIAGWDVDDRPSLMASILVSRRFPPEYRFASLSWSHHREVAKLEPDVAHGWLQDAEAEGWSVHRMREAIRESKRLAAPKQTEAVPKPWHIVHQDAVREIAELFAGQPDAIVLLSSDGTWKTV